MRQERDLTETEKDRRETKERLQTHWRETLEKLGRDQRETVDTLYLDWNETGDSGAGERYMRRETLENQLDASK